MDNVVLFFLEKNKNKFYSIDQLLEIALIDKEELCEILNKLEIEGKVYQNEHNEYSCMPQNYILGELHSTRKGKKYIELKDGNRVYISDDSLNGALDFDLVVVDIADIADSTLKGQVKRILKRNNSHVVCEVKNINGIKNLAAFNVPSDMNFVIDKEKMNSLVDGDRVIISVPIKQNNGVYQSEFVKYLCHKNDPDKDARTIAASKDIEVDFNDEVINEVNKIPQRVYEEEIIDRVDLRDKMIFTIDGEHTKDIDDAVSLDILPNGNFELGVHIAHVSHYVKFGTAIFDDAYSRGTSVYMLDYVIPMIHHLLSNGICSLNPNEDRLTRSCVIEFDRNGDIVNYRIFKSVIRSKKKMTYEDVNKILEENIGPIGYEEYADTIRQMGVLSKILTNKRNQQGGLTFASNEVNVSLDENGKATDFSLTNRGDGEKLIENFMVSANEVVASHIYWQNLPFVYRVHDCPTENLLNDTIKFISNLGYRLNTIKNCRDVKLVQAILNTLSEHEEFPVLSSLLLRSMKRAMYDTNNIGHFGLASNMYTHFTSPIRRFPDLMVHTLLDEYEKIYEVEGYYEKFLQDNLSKLEDYLKGVCKHSSYKERQADLAEEEINKFKMIEYMKQYIGQTFEGTILMVNNNSISIKTDNGITGKALFEDILGDAFIYNHEKCRLYGRETRQQYRIGNRISITVKDVVPEEKEIYFYVNENISRKDKNEKVKRIEYK